MKEKKKALIPILTMLVLIVILLGIAYALFTFVGEGKVINSVTLKKLKIVLEEDNEINIQDAYPQEDAKALESEGYSFRLINGEGVNANYRIYLDNVEIEEPDEKLVDDYIKFSLEKDGVKGDAKFLTSLGEDGNRIIDENVINSGDTYNYTLRVWVTTEKDIILNDLNNRNPVWKGKIRIEGEQA